MRRLPTIKPVLSLLALLLVCLPLLVAADWDFSKRSVPLDQIMSGGTSRDEIPALTSPKFVPAAEARFVRDDEQVLGVVLQGVAKAYPTRILSWHELVNDAYRELPVLVSWCPLAHTGVVFARQIKDKERVFGVSGMLYRSNLLMYDRGTGSLWSQIKGEAVTGPLTGTGLEVLPSRLTTWGKWRKTFPDSQVLSTDTGFVRDYTSDPYLDYYQRPKGFWSFFTPGPGEKEKELVVGVTLDGVARAWPLELVRQQGVIVDRISGQKLKLTFDPASDLLQVTGENELQIPSLIAYWFVWKGIHPQTERYTR